MILSRRTRVRSKINPATSKLVTIVTTHHWVLIRMTCRDLIASLRFLAREVATLYGRCRHERFRSRRPANNKRSEEHTSELQSLMRISYAVFCLTKKKKKTSQNTNENSQPYHYYKHIEI